MYTKLVYIFCYVYKIILTHIYLLMFLISCNIHIKVVHYISFIIILIYF